MKHRLLWAAGICLIVLSVGLFAGCDSGPKDQAEMPKFPDHTSIRVSLRPVEKSEAIRYDFYAKDKKTRLGTQIEYVDGVTTFIFYRPDSTTAQLKEFYPAPKDPKDPKYKDARQLKRLITYDADGKTYLSDKAWRLDGTREYVGERLVDGNWELRYFFDDGVATLKHRLIDSKKELISEEVFRQDGTLEKETKHMGSDTLVVTTYSPTRTKLSYATYTGTDGDAQYFYDDGITVRMTVKSTSWKIEVRNFDKKGVLTEGRDFSYSQMQVTVYKNGVASYKQTWSVDMPGSEKAKKRIYTLSTVEYLRANGSVKRRIDFAAGKPNRVVYPVEGNYWAGKVVAVRDDGTTSEIVVKDNDGKVTSNIKHTPQDNVREKFNTKHFEPTPYEEPQGVDKLRMMRFRGRFGF